MLIRTPDHRLRVFVSSTLNELAEERNSARQAIQNLRMSPVMFETSARPHPAQNVYQSYLLQSQIFIGIYWQSYGWLAPEQTISGLEDEYNLSANIPRLIYIKDPAPEREPALADLITRIENDKSSSYTFFSTPAQLKELVQNDLALLLTERFESYTRPAPPKAQPKAGPQTNVPIPRNPLIGRESEFTSLCQLLHREDIALITLTGAGGTGKSRLAIQIGLENLAQFQDGVFMVRLETIRDPNLVIPMIAETLGVRDTPDGLPIAEMLKEYLRDKQMLLLLDNFEHVVKVAPVVAELLETCPRLKCIVTSRTPLRLRLEKVFSVTPLPLPSLQEPAIPEDISQIASIKLFIQRAQSVRSDFSLTSANAPVITEICHRLDGLPLAIELAAARIKMLTPATLLTRLEHRFDLLTSGTRDLPERQRTLRQAIDWSYNLLTETEKKLFRRLSVFVGSWSLEAAEAVCALEADISYDLDDALAALLDYNLVFQLPDYDFAPRFGMLSTIHEYASERLLASAENDAIHLQHAQYFLKFIIDVEPRVRSAERVLWQQVMQQDFGNIRGVLEWVYQARKSIEIGQKIVIAMGMYWQVCGYIAEGHKWSTDMLSLCDYTTPLNIHAGLLCIKGLLTWSRGDQSAAYEITDMALELSRKQDDDGPLSRALIFRGLLASAARDLDMASAMFAEALELFRKTNDLWSEAVTLAFIADVALYQNDVERATQLYDESIRLARNQGDPWCLMPALMSSARFAVMKDDLAAAQSKLLEIIEVLNIPGDHWSLAWMLIDLGYVTFMQGNLDQAASHIREALSLASTYGNQRALIIALAEAAAVIASQCNHDTSELTLAANLCGVTANYLEMPGLFIWFNTQRLYENAISRAQSSMSADLWEEGYTEGKCMPTDWAATLATETLNKCTGAWVAQ